MKLRDFGGQARFNVILLEPIGNQNQVRFENVVLQCIILHYISDVNVLDAIEPSGCRHLEGNG